MNITAPKRGTPMADRDYYFKKTSACRASNEALRQLSFTERTIFDAGEMLNYELYARGGSPPPLWLSRCQ